MEVKIEKEMRNEKEFIFIVYIDNKKSNYHNDKNLNENERKEIQKRISNMRNVECYVQYLLLEKE